MRFRKITFSNYRCFHNGSISFSEDNSAEKSINLILGPNGGGKTELLFSFLWTLYGFDFKSLKGKEATPYALQASQYRDLQRGLPGATASCFVEIELVDEGTRYFIKRTATFTKQGRTINSSEEQELSYLEPSTERSLPIRDGNEIRSRLSRIIPESTLRGLVFDGERMQQLSRMDNSSKKVVQGVVRDITNVEFLEQCRNVFEGSRDSVTRSFRRSGQTGRGVERDLQQAADDLAKADATIEEKTPLLASVVEEIASDTERIDDITKVLEQERASQELALQRREAEARRSSERDRLADAYSDLATTLNDGYLLCAGSLFEHIESIAEAFDVPEDLQASSIAAILEGTHCICGEPLDDGHRHALEDLMRRLPPNNINSTVLQSVRSLRQYTEDVRESSGRVFRRIRDAEREIKAQDDKIRDISAQLQDFDDEQIRELDAERGRLIAERAKLSEMERLYRSLLDGAEKKREEALSQQRKLAQKHSELRGIQVQADFYEKAIQALKLIKKRQEARALIRINEKLSSAYELISEDARLGRRLHLCMFDTSAQYQLIVFNQRTFDDLFEALDSRGQIAAWKSEGLSEEEIKERVILRCAESNSTGQNKINTLAFVKAILDYANEPRRDSTFEITKDYPLLIDAPFGDIFEDNLYLSSKELHSFAGQIILMLADESYQAVKAQLERHVSRTFVLDKSGPQEGSVIVEA